MAVADNTALVKSIQSAWTCILFASQKDGNAGSKDAQRPTAALGVRWKGLLVTEDIRATHRTLDAAPTPPPREL